MDLRLTSVRRPPPGDICRDMPDNSMIPHLPAAAQYPI